MKTSQSTNVSVLVEPETQLVGIGWPLVLLPMHVLFMERVTDPTCSVAFEMEPEDRGIMQRPARKPDDRLFTPGTLIKAALQGLGALDLAIAALIWTNAAGFPDNEVRPLTFGIVIAAKISLTFSNRSLTDPIWKMRPANPALYILTFAAVSTLMMIFYVPAFERLFHISRPSMPDVLLIVAAGVVALGWMELVKLALRLARRP